MVVLGAIAVAALLALPAAASASFTVNSTGDVADATLNGTCDDGTGHCTLRAAIQEANNTAAMDEIFFDSTIFNGTTAATITLGSVLPTLIHQTNIAAGGCTSGGAPIPCVAIKGDGTFDGITMGAGSSGSRVGNVDLFKLRTGIVDSAGGGDIEGNWFGIDLAGSPTSNANTNGVRELGNGGTIGGSSAAARNVFANDSATGLSIEGGDTNGVRGNYFGTTPAGALDANLHNMDSIVVSSLVVGPNSASGNIIGGADTNSNSACDGACNLLGNTVDDEIELSGNSVSGGSPAVNTTISGNYIGEQLDGTDGSTANEFTSGSWAIEFHIGSPTAENTVVGGASPADRNYIGGNRTGLDTGQVTTSGTIENNYFGIQPDGSGTVANQFDNLDAAGTNASSGVLIKNNLIGSDGFSVSASFGIALYGQHAVIQGNTLGVDATGAAAPFTNAAITLQGGSGVGNTLIGGTSAGDGNVIAGGRTSAFGSGGISVAGDATNTTIEGNSIGTDSTGTANYGNTGAGIDVLASTPGGGSSRTTIGSDSPAAPNLISHSTGPAIAVHQMRDVQIAGNSGTGNGGPFIDLENPAGVGNGPGPGTNPGDGSANGLQSPSIGTPSTTSVSGAGADAGATIRVFAKTTASIDGELGALIGTGTADGSGNWTVTFTGAQPELQRMVATQTRFGVNMPETSEVSSVVQVPDTTPPVTTIDTQPPPLTNNPNATLTFHANETATFTCKVDASAPIPCASGDTFGPLSQGPHTIVVTATDSSSTPETSPPSASFTVDSVAPVTTIDSAPSGTTTNHSPTITFHATDASSVTFTCRVDGGTQAPCTSPATFGPLSDGHHTISVRASDAAGNVESPPKSASFTISTPMSTTAPPPATTSNTPIQPAKKKCKKKKHRAAAAKKCKKKKK